MKQKIMRKERVYVKVTSDFDATGYMQPRAITWADGRVFPIDTVKDFRPAGSHHDSPSCDCYTIIVKGETKYLFSSGQAAIRKALSEDGMLNACL